LSTLSFVFVHIDFMQKSVAFMTLLSKISPFCPPAFLTQIYQQQENDSCVARAAHLFFPFCRGLRHFQHSNFLGEYNE